MSFVPRALLLCLALLAGPAWGLEAVSIQLKWRHQFQFAGYYAALEQGYYRDAGLDVTLIEGRPGTDTVEEVLSGRAQYGVGTSSLLLARAAGKPVVMLAAIFQHSPWVLLMLDSPGAPRGLADLVGKRVMLEPDGHELIAYLRRKGIDPERLQYVPHTQTVDALAAGKVAAMSAYACDEPFELESRGEPYRTFSPRDAGIDFYGDNLFTSQGEIDLHPKRAAALRAATLAGWRYALQHPDEMIELIGHRYARGRYPDHLRFEAKSVLQLVDPGTVDIGYSSPVRWRRIAEDYASLGMLAGPVELEGFLYNPDPRISPETLLRWAALAGTVLLAGGSLFAYVLRLNRRLAAEVREREAAEQQFLHLLETAPVPIAITGLQDQRILFVNQMTSRMFGIDPRDVVGRPVLDFYADPEDREHLMARLSGTTGCLEQHEMRLRLPDGTPIWVQMSARVSEYAGQPAIYSAFTDITMRKQAEVELAGAHRELASANTQLRDANRELALAASTDLLTGLWNRRHMEQQCAQEISRARRYGHALSLIIMDIDHFKQINDRCGHAMGDRVLRRFADAMTRELRESDVLARWGGEEFVLLMPHTGLNEAVAVAEKLRLAVEGSDFGAVGRVSASFGVATLGPRDNAEDLLRWADRSLYRAKELGRNRVEAQPPTEALFRP